MTNNQRREKHDQPVKASIGITAWLASQFIGFVTTEDGGWLPIPALRGSEVTKISEWHEAEEMKKETVRQRPDVVSWIIKRWSCKRGGGVAVSLAFEENSATNPTWASPEEKWHCIQRAITRGRKRKVQCQSNDGSSSSVTDRPDGTTLWKVLKKLEKLYSFRLSLLSTPFANLRTKRRKKAREELIVRSLL